MSFKNKNKFLAVLIMLVLTTVPLFTGIYLADPGTTSKLFEGVRQRKASTDLTQRSKVLGEKIYLLKNRGLVVNKCRVVFKGIRDRMICMDAFLLELDPEYAYRHSILIPDAITGFRMGTTRFKLVSASNSKLILKADARY